MFGSTTYQRGRSRACVSRYFKHFTAACGAIRIDITVTLISLYTLTHNNLYTYKYKYIVYIRHISRLFSIYLKHYHTLYTTTKYDYILHLCYCF